MANFLALDPVSQVLIVLLVLSIIGTAWVSYRTSDFKRENHTNYSSFTTRTKDRSNQQADTSQEIWEAHNDD
ncbi:hypothetical protein EQG49_07225 [Periweissella cryptocerci]|uniref:Uncharacterized protein n=1 Tax=Periweissella cryptocerci TaxID=2506420 RepID=A0A4P6YU76_9LACO|nr:hypothetical protein [Periweissella cryptocerci]QBO36266.1 hypothetical protein EQG49_07225 [Periweissella cryptocerci]